MATKKIKRTPKKKPVVKVDEIEELEIVPIVTEPVMKIQPLAIDYQSEQLNDMARKINEIIFTINAL